MGIFGVTRAGRPIRAFALIMLGWTACRIVATTSLPTGLPRAFASERQLYDRLTFEIPPSIAKEHFAEFPDQSKARFSTLPAGRFGIASPLSLPPAPTDIYAGGFKAAGDDRYADPLAQSSPAAAPANDPVLSSGSGGNRWSMDAWMLVRNGGSRTSLASYGQLGASQAGMRLQYDLTPGQDSRIALYSRVASALDTPHAPEASLGVAYRPKRSLPFDIAVERRISLGDGARNAFAVIGTTGFGPLRAPFGLQSEGYVQAGFVGLKSKEAFMDGKIALHRNLAGDRIAIGLSASGGAQRNLTRVDIGPHLQMRFSTGKLQSRLAAEWRQRIIGCAQPGSGPALTLAAGF